jgi:hypothetical protein
MLMVSVDNPLIYLFLYITFLVGCCEIKFLMNSHATIEKFVRDSLIDSVGKSRGCNAY